MYKDRYLETKIINLSRTFPVVLLTGAGQVGKTTLLEHINREIPKLGHRYVSLDEFQMGPVAKWLFSKNSLGEGDTPNLAFLGISQRSRYKPAAK